MTNSDTFDKATRHYILEMACFEPRFESDEYLFKEEIAERKRMEIDDASRSFHPDRRET